MSLEEYREFSLKAMENYDAIGKRASINIIKNDKKFKKKYESQQNYGKKIISQIVKKLEQIDLSLLNYIKNKDDKDDW